MGTEPVRGIPTMHRCPAEPAPPFLLRRREFLLAGARTRQPVFQTASRRSQAFTQPIAQLQWLGIVPNPRFPVVHTPVAITVYWQPRGAKAPRGSDGGRGLGRDMQRTGSPRAKSGWAGSRAPVISQPLDK